MLTIVQTALEAGVIYALVALALFLSYTILDIADLTTDGAFTLGCAVSATVCLMGHPVLALPMAMLAGAAAGFVTAFLQTKLGVPSILAGIITNFGLYSVNLTVMGSANVNLYKSDTIFSLVKETGFAGSWHKLLVASVVVLAVCVLLVLFLGTRLGLSIRATGDNTDMVRASSINPVFTITVGLCLANAMTALSGALIAQYQKSADMNLGTGMVVLGLASLIIGQSVISRGKSGILRGVVAVVVGSLIYRAIYAVALKFNVTTYLKLITAVIVALAIAAPALKDYFLLQRRKRAALSERRRGAC
ncbi:ABC transporter permease [Intestinimonas butyriciproducens]|uniref:Putative ABC transport system permease protein n=1 Tax=Intestinimonas butyriciproducens TaxID=1297617 RepID=A0A2U1CD68_9FIRM|nr:ABC transporter permease [Intestinimonas butyriciproducens]SCI84861.1 beta-methylgalactoside transporter inner membrane component [uncultured Clostridium sp.]MCI6363868.1 ABC transporter permease [Intestinimonas butyriciproducens]MCR1905797.1 ABC transporter permease [Intestinimonas butyriciproducens]MDB7816707.1 ABC transporter permease [Intestinimonas butyriciproducens]MDB7842523.1 ABC transporter permease [Intestinimonas butyriciproducens]